MATAQRTAIVYSDITNNIDVHPISGDALRLTNQEAVKRAIRNLLLTAAGERPYQPNIGSGLRHLLFEPINPVTEQMIAEHITQTINTYEPRAKLQYVNVNVNPDNAAYSALIVFSMVNITEPITLSVILQRIR